MMVKKQSKQEEIKERAIKHGLLFIKREFKTIRALAKYTGFNKSTVHLDLHKLEEFHPALYEKVKEKLDFNNSTKHIRGGESNKKNIERKKNNDSK
jgi:hypothetical protein